MISTTKYREFSGKYWDEYRYGFNGMESDDEIKNHHGNSYDFGARMYDPRVGRWFTPDPLEAKYTDLSPYNFVGNSPIMAMDPNGKDIYIVIWFSKDDETGHAGIAVDNYKWVETKVIENGQEVTKRTRVPDGTVTYYDLWPEKQVGQTELQDGVKDDYNRRKYTVEELTNIDVSKSNKSGHVSQNGKGRPADGVIKLRIGDSVEEQRSIDKAVKMKLEGVQDSGKDYNACSNNCSSFVQEGLKAAISGFDASQYVDVPFSMDVLYDDVNVVAPNNLYNKAASSPGAEVLKGPSKIEAKPYLEYYGK